jgi:hypothetical protein
MRLMALHSSANDQKQRIETPLLATTLRLFLLTSPIDL